MFDARGSWRRKRFGDGECGLWSRGSGRCNMRAFHYSRDRLLSLCGGLLGGGRREECGSSGLFSTRRLGLGLRGLRLDNRRRWLWGSRFGRGGSSRGGARSSSGSFGRKLLARRVLCSCLSTVGGQWADSARLTVDEGTRESRGGGLGCLRLFGARGGRLHRALLRRHICFESYRGFVEGSCITIFWWGPFGMGVSQYIHGYSIAR